MTSLPNFAHDRLPATTNKKVSSQLSMAVENIKANEAIAAKEEEEGYC